MLRQDIRFFTSHDGIRLGYGVTGNGPPLVFPATIGTHLELDIGLLGYKHWLEGLSTHHTLYRGELRGSGLSDWDVPSMTFEDWVADLEGMVDDAGLDRFPLFGLSHGTAQAIAYAARHPERVSALVLYAASATPLISRFTEHDHHQLRVFLEFQSAFWYTTDPRYQIFFSGNTMPDAPREVIFAMDEARRKAMNPENANSALLVTISTDVFDLLPQLRVPTLVLHPRRGSAVTINTARRVAAAIPDARLVLLEADNHIIQEYEAGWPVLLDETWRFLGVGAGSPALQEEYGHEPDPGLSAREREVLALIAEHRTNAQIAEALVISPATASRHVHNILGKLGINRRSEAAAWWTTNGNSTERHGPHKPV